MGKKEDRDAKREWWKKELQGYPTVVDYFLWKARKEKGIFGEVVISPALIDQIVTLNNVCLEGQAEIIYNVFIYRVFKWHWWVEKVDELVTVTPVAPPSFTPLLVQKERLENYIKAGLASAAQAVADYELLKHDERKYREILDYFKEGEKDEHVLRALFVDRIDAHMGEGYSMITMARRWPTIISDFLKMKSEWNDVETIRKNLKVSVAEANVLKTKNELFKEWKKLFFPDVRERYARIKNLLESRKRSVHEYREWLKPYLSRLKMIKESAEIAPYEGLTDVTKMSFTPQGEVVAKLWFWKGVKAEELGQPIIISGWGEVPIYDDWVKEHIVALEAKYDIYLSEKEILGLLETFKTGGRSIQGKKPDIFAKYPAPMIDERFLYYSFIDLDYVCQYKKGSTGPMVVEDQYWHFHPFLFSKNFMFFALLELEYKKRRFAQDIEKLIGVTTEEEKFLEEVKKAYPEPGKNKEEKAKQKSFLEKWKEAKISWSQRKRKFKKAIRPLLRFFVKPGPYEINVGERISKTYGLYFGAEIAGLRDLIKETAYRLSGQRP
ncbi:MAG: hypothetical protein QW051_00380 [Candidatus Aenigmatarchaeota archaeon]